MPLPFFVDLSRGCKTNFKKKFFQDSPTAFRCEAFLVGAARQDNSNQFYLYNELQGFECVSPAGDCPNDSPSIFGPIRLLLFRISSSR